MALVVVDVRSMIPRNVEASRRRALKPGECHCYICGKPCADLDTPGSHAITITSGGCDAIPGEQEDEALAVDSAGYMGGHPVGPACYKRLVAAFRAKGWKGAV